GRRNDAVHEPDPVRFGGVDHLAGEEELQRASLADETWQALRGAVAGNDAELHLGLAELRRLGSETNVTGHRELASAAEREAVDGGERRLRRLLEPTKDALAPFGARLSLDGVLLGELRDVGPRHERAPGTGEQTGA